MEKDCKTCRYLDKESGDCDYTELDIKKCKNNNWELYKPTRSELKFYCGIGSRQTPKEYLDMMVEIGQLMAEKLWCLRSGGADGADTAFEQGCDLVGGDKEIFLPWKSFNKNKSFLYNVLPEAEEIAKRIHPAWGACSHGAKKLLSRNVHQVFGEDLHKSVSAIICWTPSETKGGTSMAIKLGRQYNVPVYNLKYFDFNKLKILIKKDKL